METVPVLVRFLGLGAGLYGSVGAGITGQVRGEAKGLSLPRNCIGPLMW